MTTLLNPTIESKMHLRSIGSHTISSNLVDRFKCAVRNNMDKNEVILCWVPGDSIVDGNEIS